jgi:enoyl-CoA hydratase
MAGYDAFEQLTVEVEGGVALVRIPEAGSVGRRQAAIHREVSEIWPALGRDDDVGAVVVTGAGDDFYVSADIGGLRAIPGLDKETTFTVLQRMSREGIDIVYRMVELDKPVVSAINGPAAGGGLAVALLADISVAAHDARLVDPHVALGVAAGDHAAMIWPLLCGMAKSKLYLLTADPLDGREAERIGLVSLSVPPEEVLPTAMRYGRRLAATPAHAVRFTKRALNQWLRLGGITAFDYSQALELLNFFGPELRAVVDAATPPPEGAGGPRPGPDPLSR